MAESEALDPLALAIDHCARAGRLDDVHLVGGRVRDALLGRPTLDTDLVVPAGAIELARDIARDLGGTLVVLDEDRAIARVVWQHGGAVLDVARQVGDSLVDDLGQRDLTANALAVPLARALDFCAADVVDPTGGQTDLIARCLRMTAPETFDRDPLRLLRAPRLAAELGFTIEPETRAAIRARSVRVGEPAAERLRDELLRLIAAPEAAANVAELDDLGLLAVLLPELAALRGVRQSWPHDQDVLAHSLSVLAAAERLQRYIMSGHWDADLSLAYRDMLDTWRVALGEHMVQSLGGRPRWVSWRLAALCHDLGKPATARDELDTGRVRFLGHEAVGATACRHLGERLRLGGRATDYLATLVAHHLRPAQLVQGGPPSRRAVYRYYAALGDEGVDVGLLSLADQLGKADRALDEDLAMGVGAILAAWFEGRDSVVLPVPLLSGHELITAFGLDPGPDVGRLLAELREAQAAGEVGDREEALGFVRSLLPGLSGTQGQGG